MKLEVITAKGRDEVECVDFYVQPNGALICTGKADMESYVTPIEVAYSPEEWRRVQPLQEPTK